MKKAHSVRLAVLFLLLFLIGASVLGSTASVATRPEPGARHLIETDPRFADYRSWLSSDFMLLELGREPSAVLKRLGDGFYEQKLVAEQIMHATGQRFVGDYTGNEAQYRALMEAGAAFGRKFRLTVGVALSAELMAQLTDDIVWLVEREVTLADGSVQRVLAPQAYVRVKEGDLKGDGTLISATRIDLKLGGDLDNNALIAARDLTSIAAQNIRNASGGRLSGGTVSLTAREDIGNLSGTIAGNAVALSAGRDVNLRTRTIETAGLGSTVTGTDRIAAVEAQSLTVGAGRDLNVQGARIEAGQDALLTAGRRIAVGTVQTGRTLDIAASGRIRAAEATNVGSAIDAGGSLTLGAGMRQDGDLTVVGSALNAGRDLTAIGTNVVIAGAVDTQDADIVTRKKNATDTVLRHRESAVASALTAAENLSIAARGSQDADGRAIAGSGNLLLQGAHIANSRGTLTLAANNDLDIVEQQLNQSEHTHHEGKGRGLLTKTSSVRIADSRSRQAAGSAVEGDAIVISAGRDATVRGGSVSGTGDVGLYAKRDVQIVAAEETASAGSFSETRKTVTGFGKAMAAMAVLAGVPELGAAAFNRKEALHNAEQTQSTAVGSAVSGATVAIGSGRDTLVKGSTVVADADIDIQAARRLELVSAEESGSERALSRGSAQGLIGGLSIGKAKGSQEGAGGSVRQVGSQIASLGTDGTGDVTLKAGEQYTQTASGVLAAQGDIAIGGKSVLIDAAHDSSNAEQRSRYSKTAMGIEVGAPLLSALQGIKGMAEAGKTTGDGRMQALAALNAGLQAKAAADGVQQLANGSLGGIKITASLGSSRSESASTQQASTAAGSSVAAGGNVKIEATGAGADSNLTAIGADIRAGHDVTLQADNQVNLLAAQSTATEHSENKSSGVKVGIGFAFGGGQNGFTLEASASKARGKADGSDVVNVNTHVTAGNVARIDSGGDATLKGAVVAGNAVKADIGGDLALESLQDSSQFDSRQTSAGVGVSVCIPPFCYGASSVSGSAGKSRVDADYLGVAEQSGIQAGDGGFEVTVGGNTDLKGAVIAGTRKSVDENRNKLVTASLTQSDLRNRDVYQAKGYSVSATVAGKLGDQGSEAAQSRMSDKDKAAASDLLNPAKPGAGAGMGGARGSRDSVTRSGIGGAAVTITDEARQKELTGQDGAAAIAKAQTGVTTGRDTTALAKGWDGQTLQAEVNAQVAVTQTFSQMAPKAVGDYAQGKLKEAADLQVLAEKETDPSKRDALQKTATELKENWKEGGIARTALHTAVGALGGGTGGAIGSAATALTTAAIADQINQLDAPKEVKDALTMMAGTVVGGVTGGMSGAASGLTQITNNYLNHKQLETLRDKLAGCKQRQCGEAERQGILSEYTAISAGNDAALAACTTRECVDGHVKAIEQARSIEYAVLRDIDGAAGNELRGRQVKNEAINNQYKKVDTAIKAGEELRQWARNNCGGISQQQCAAKLSKEKAFVAGLVADFTPIVGDIKAFAEAQGPADYVLAVIGTVAGPVGDALGAAKKAVTAAEVADVGKNVATVAKGVELAATRASVDDKLARYLLNAEHPVGGSKAKWFDSALGFNPSNADQLAKQIVFNEASAVQTAVTEHGIKFNQVIPVTGANGKVIDVTFGWIRNNDGIVRLTTAIPTKK